MQIKLILSTIIHGHALSCNNAMAIINLFVIRVKLHHVNSMTNDYI